MSMRHLETEFRKQGKGNLADIIASVHKLNGSDIPLPSVISLVDKQVRSPKTPALRVSEIQTFSGDQLILPETALPQEVSAILQRAEKAGIGVFEAHHLSDITLTKDTNVEGWDKKPENWYWDQIKNGEVSPDAAKLPGSWVLIDKTPKPDYKDGKQLHEKDPFGPLLVKLREDKKIQSIKGMPDTSRFGISHNELTQVVLPEIAKLLGVDASQVRLPKEIEFNLIGNLKHPEWGNTNTWEWLNDKFEDDDRLFGGSSGSGGLARVDYRWSGNHDGNLAFRPLVVVSPKA